MAETLNSEAKGAVFEPLSGKRVLLGVCGGIAAYRSCELARLLRARGAGVRVVMTEAACRFVTPMTFEALTGQRVFTGAAPPEGSAMAHIALGTENDLIVIAPATANTIARLACGLADNLLCETVLASGAPVLLAPAMNSRMWLAPQTQANIEALKKQGRFLQVGPAEGELACGESGPGRMSEPEEICEAAEAALGPGSLKGRTVMVTAGPTREPLDAVRFLSNRSSGKMGYALAREARRRGAKVVLVSGPTALRPPWDVELLRVATAAEMERAVMENLAGCDVLVMAAAVADYTVPAPASGKLKKKGQKLRIELAPTTDILSAVAGRKRRPPLVVGFAAETGHPVAEARRKLEAKRLAMVVANDVTKTGAGFDTDTNKAWLVTAGGETELPLMHKQALAAEIFTAVERMLNEGQRPARNRRART